jgi:hypothetical protein
LWPKSAQYARIAKELPVPSRAHSGRYETCQASSGTGFINDPSDDEERQRQGWGCKRLELDQKQPSRNVDEAMATKQTQTLQQVLGALSQDRSSDKGRTLLKIIVQGADQQVIDQLPDLFADQTCDKHLRISLAHAIGDDEFVKRFSGLGSRLIPILNDESIDIHVRGAVATALGHIGDPSAATPLKDLLASLRVKLDASKKRIGFAPFAITAAKGMQMPCVRKRFERLEKSLFPKPDSAVDHVVVSQALHCLSTEELMSLRDAAADRQQGKVRELTEHELAALAAYGSALDLECQRAGFRAIAGFERSRGRSH